VVLHIIHTCVSVPDGNSPEKEFTMIQRSFNQIDVHPCVPFETTRANCVLGIIQRTGGLLTQQRRMVLSFCRVSVTIGVYSSTRGFRWIGSSNTSEAKTSSLNHIDDQSTVLFEYSSTRGFRWIGSSNTSEAKTSSLNHIDDQSTVLFEYSSTRGFRWIGSSNTSEAKTSSLNHIDDQSTVLFEFCRTCILISECELI